MDKDPLAINNKPLEDKGFLESVLESIQDGICVLNPDLTIRYANKFVQDWCKENTPVEGKKCFEAAHNRTDPCNNCPTLRCMEANRIKSLSY